ncbi:ATP synthase F1 subunit epsilon [Candidatus Microgenomates bacterium]|nr:MAG: ATP synthase F1 subunit epsilon [Candidatus Microgenomates bacterium]
MTVIMIHLEIITPEKIAYTSDVDMVSVPGVGGTLGILPKHIPLFAQLGEGELKIKKGSEEIYLGIGGGFVEVTDKKVIILVTRAVRADDLNEADILRAKKQAEEALKSRGASIDRSEVQASLRRSLLDLKIVNRRKRSH